MKYKQLWGHPTKKKDRNTIGKRISNTNYMIALYIQKMHRAPNTHYTIYAGPDGLRHTTGSMEYKDKKYKPVLRFYTGDEVLTNITDICNMVFLKLEN